LILGVDWWSVAIAVGLSSMLMQLSRTMHPPAAGDSIFFMTSERMTMTPTLISVILGSVILVTCFYLFHREIAGKKYPQYWY
jgi:CBS-domain-containing membrane protein